MTPAPAPVNEGREPIPRDQAGAVSPIRRGDCDGIARRMSLRRRAARRGLSACGRSYRRPDL